MVKRITFYQEKRVFAWSTFVDHMSTHARNPFNAHEISCRHKIDRPPRQIHIMQLMYRTYAHIHLETGIN